MSGDNLKTASELNKELREDYIADHKTELSDDDLTMFPYAKKSCKKCYGGRGYSSWDLNGNIILCNCIVNRIGKVPLEEGSVMTYGEYKSMNSTLNRGVVCAHVRSKGLRRRLSRIKKLSRKWRKRNEVVSENLKAIYQEGVNKFSEGSEDT